ncbi:MAG TPA: universal stress protein, partial [Anaerolineae bacterium]|nr:universal stress protein [Anaerolineae bacterium]
MYNYRVAAHAEWSRARRKALWAQLQAGLGHRKINLINFTELSHYFNLGSSFYRGVQDIPLDKIVGSVGRYQDFVQAFLPVNESMSDRWESIAAAYLDPQSRGLPPIEVCQVGDCYFVKDGNHRVSVARHLKLPDIEAHVWEYIRAVAGLAPGVDVDTLLLQAERRDFLAKTCLDELRSGHTLHLTAPGGYTAI